MADRRADRVTYEKFDNALHNQSQGYFAMQKQPKREVIHNLHQQTWRAVQGVSGKFRVQTKGIQINFADAEIDRLLNFRQIAEYQKGRKINADLRNTNNETQKHSD